MIKDLTINASLREGYGKGHARRLRTQGMIPVAVYGEEKPPVAVAVNAKEIAAILRSETGHNTIFNLALPQENGGTDNATVIIKEWQVDPVRGQLLHADMLRLSMTTATQVNVSIEIMGEPAGVKTQGGLLDLQMRVVHIECLPGDIPEHITLDVSALQVGDHAKVSDLIYDRDKVTMLTDENLIVAGVLAPRLTEAAQPTAEEAIEGAEPEVITKDEE